MKDGSFDGQYWKPRPLPVLEDKEFLEWRKLLEEKIGLQIPEQRRGFLKTTLGIRMNELSVDSYSDYYNQVTNAESAIVEWSILVDRLTVQETRFFRDHASCQVFRDYFRSKVSESSANFNVWSVGCSTGEEPYSLSILLNEVLRKAEKKHRYSITATDVSTPVIAKAKKGQYQLRKVADIPLGLRRSYFEEIDDMSCIKDVVKDRVCFSRLNVLDIAESPFDDFDVIYCQNLLIYFRKWLRKQIVDNLVSRLKPGGLLILGLGELVGYEHPNLVKIPGENTLAFLRKTEE